MPMERAFDFGYEFDCYLLELEGPSGSVKVRAEFRPKYLEITFEGDEYSTELLLQYTGENVQKLTYLFGKYVRQFMDKSDIKTLLKEVSAI